MGMDGLSMSNTGIRREATSLDHSKESEETAKQDTEKSMIVQELTEQERVNEEREENKKRRKSQKGKFEDDNEDDDEDGAVEDDLDEEIESEEEDDVEEGVSAENLLLVDGENHGFYTKLSKNLENIELYDRITDRLIGTITPEELSALISKLNMGTGIFINKKV